MFQKIAPLIVLTIFAVAVYLMMTGMNNALDLTDHKKVKEKQAQAK